LVDITITLQLCVLVGGIITVRQQRPEFITTTTEAVA
jgi:hypothetical protein